MLNRFITVLVLLSALLMLVMGVQWLVVPSFIAGELGMELLHGLGRSTQIGNLMSFFISTGCCALIGLVTRKAAWFYASAMLLGCAALGRLLAWALHDASLAISHIPAELLMVMILVIAAKRLGKAV